MESTVAQSTIKNEVNILAVLGNFLLLSMSLLTGMILAFIAATARKGMAGLSHGMYPDGPIMGSWLLDAFLHSWVAVLFGLILIAAIAKEFFIKPFRQRVIINAVLLIVLMSLTAMLVHSYTTAIREITTTSMPTQ